jgi:hypothetical protein
MNIKQTTASLAALMILAGGPAIALATTNIANNPIAISDVNVQPDSDDDGFGPGFVSLDFQNTSNVKATEVIFQLNVDGAKVGRFKDVGSFAPGVTVRHGFLNNSTSPDAQLTVAKVKFADGSEWVPPYVAPKEDD